MKKERKTHGVKSGGNQALAPKILLPVEPHRTWLPNNELWQLMRSVIPGCLLETQPPRCYQRLVTWAPSTYNLPKSDSQKQNKLFI